MVRTVELNRGAGAGCNTRRVSQGMACPFQEGVETNTILPEFRGY